MNKEHMMDEFNMTKEKNINMTNASRLKNNSTDGARVVAIRSYDGHCWAKMSAQTSNGAFAEWPASLYLLECFFCFLDIDWIQLRKSPPLMCFFDTEWWLKLLCEWGKHVKLNQSLDHNTEKAYSTETQSQQTSLRFAFSSPALSPSYPGEKPWRLPSLPLPGAKFQWKAQMPRCT